ncbi:MAG: lipopolysaccharide biosynthesis protein [Planctomycetaceae bacterium]
MPTIPARKPVTLLSDAFGAMTVRVVGMVLLFASTTLAARVLGPEEYGAFNAAFSLAVLLATLAPLGADRIMLRNLSTTDSTEVNAHETALTHHTTAVVGIALFVVLMLGVLLGNTVGISDSWQVTFFLSAVMFFPVALTYLRQWVAIPMLGTRQALMPEQTIIPLGFMVILWILKVSGSELTAFSASCAYAGVMLALWLWTVQQGILGKIYAQATQQQLTLAAIAQRVREGLPFTGVALGTAMLNRSLPLVVVATCGFSAAAQFSIAHSFANLAGIPLGILNLCILPRCTTLVRNSSLHEASRLVGSTAGLALLMSAGIGITTCILSPVAIELLGASYSQISLILWLLVIAAVCDAIPGPSIALLQAMHLEGLWSRIVLTFVPLQLATVWVASHLGGLTGAAIGYLVTRAIYNLLIVGAVYYMRGILIVPRFSLSWISEPLIPQRPPEPEPTH